MQSLDESKESKEVITVGCRAIGKGLYRDWKIQALSMGMTMTEFLELCIGLYPHKSFHKVRHKHRKPSKPNRPGRR